MLPAPSFSITKINSSDVESATRALSDSATTGIGDISTKMLKLSCKAISGVLAEIFNQSAASSFFPGSWKSVIVIPVFKKVI